MDEFINLEIKLLFLLLKVGSSFSLFFLNSSRFLRPTIMGKIPNNPIQAVGIINLKK